MTGSTKAHRKNKTNPRALAALAVTQICHGCQLDVALTKIWQRPDGTDNTDRALIQELVYGTVRWYYALDAVAMQLLEKPIKAKDAELRALILVGLYQLKHMRVVTHAAVNETVDACNTLGKEWAKGLVNAVLRAYLRRQQALDQKIEQDPVLRYSISSWLYKACVTAWPNAQDYLQASNMHPPMTLRVNTQRTTRDNYLRRLEQENIKAHVVVGIDSALMLSQPLPVEKIPGFFDGDVSVQDAAAQCATFLLAPQQGERVLDACAAPGGKTCHLQEYAHGEIDLTAVDHNANRLRGVQENLQRLGLQAKVVVGNMYESEGWWDGQLFDAILLDVPCSATGVIRRHPDIKLHRRAADIAGLVRVQAKMLRAAWRMLKSGGRLLYATCSILPQENANMIEEFSSMQDDAVLRDTILPSGRAVTHGWQILTGEGNMDGFYYALLERRSH